MTINEMFDELENKVRDTYIVTLKYKYDFEENYTIENHILEYDSKADSYVWQNDWNEGHTDVEVLGYMIIGDVDTTKLEPCDDCISREQTLKAFAEKCGGECACCEYNGSGYDNAENCKLIKSMPSVTPQQTSWIPIKTRPMTEEERELKTYREFADWLVNAVLEEDWEESADFYAEVICRKLTKLGKLKVVDNKYMEVNADGDSN